MQTVVFDSVVSKIRTPDGTMFVNVLENIDGEPIGIIINIGKSGSSVAAWAQALASICTAALQNGTKLEALLTELSCVTSTGSARSSEVVVTSGPEGLYVALLKYRRTKFEELKAVLGTDFSDDALEEEESYNARRSR